MPCLCSTTFTGPVFTQSDWTGRAGHLQLRAIDMSAHSHSMDSSRAHVRSPNREQVKYGMTLSMDVVRRESLLELGTIPLSPLSMHDTDR
ncbi:hypothetical protein PDE_00644 [Penicillium oxalicum 114-2]|uniref:Uncharacterized protein n=1 Tax=Penicillium oxalicum (strain 114-2 / CGMCC 5302) TaxID=933388 RepID=S7Z5B6_PENO1|nr:hypothetical protein PDE_00644 [Penicillium oxalicum 114-2]